MLDERPDRRGFLGAAAMGLGGVAALAVPMTASAAGDRRDHLVVGSWMVTIIQLTPPPSPPAPAFPAQFRALFSYLPGGVVLETDQTVMGGPQTSPASNPTESPVHGSWGALGDHRARYTCIGLEFNPQDGTPFGLSIFSETLSIDPGGDSYKGYGDSAQLIDENGNVLFSGTYSTSARRLTVSGR